MGGETAEMPSVYEMGKYDLAGYCVGILEDGTELPRIESFLAGDLLISLPSSGLHCSGFNTILELLNARQVDLRKRSEFGDNSKTLGQQLAEPTRLYVGEVLQLLKKGCVKAVAHITNGLVPDVQRIIPENFEISLDFGDLKIPEVFGWLTTRLNLLPKAMLQSLNCGIGLVLIVPQKNTDWKTIKGAKVLGVLKEKLKTVAQKNQIEVRNFEDILEKVAAKFGDLGKKMFTENEDLHMQSNLTTKVLQRSECFFTQTGKHLTRVPKTFKDPILVMGTDGVGTKIKIAQETNRNSTVGIDLVAMCVNDILCNGAEPFTFSSYYACGKFQPDTARAIMAGVSEGALQAGSSLVGTHIAEVPLLYKPHIYDLAGFSLGIAEQTRILPLTSEIKPADILIGLPSSGVHSNGFSLVHAVMKQAEVTLADKAPFSNRTFGEELLTPTRIYVKALTPLIESGLVKALAHITGGGLTENLPRVLTKNLAVRLDARAFAIPPVFGWLATQGNITSTEMQRTYNCGLGMVLVIDAQNVDKVLSILQYTERATQVGTVVQRESINSPQVIVEHFDRSLLRVQQTLRLPRKRVAVLISGSGTNLQALIDASFDSAQGLNSDIALVISNKPDVMGLERAKRAGIPTIVISHKDFKTREEFDAEMSKHLVKARIDIVCLAGFMRVVSEQFVRQWRGKLVNIHPSLLPKHPGLHVQKKALEAGDTESGCTVHFVDEGVDTGAIIVQSRVPIMSGDNEELLTKRILVAEHFAFPKALRLLATGSVKLSKEGKTVFV